MSNLSDRISELLGKGYHCSQIMMQLSLDLREREEPEVIRALGALGGGMFSQRNCGALTGGACVMSSYCPRGEGEPEPTDEYKPMASEFVEWFEKANGSIQCAELVEHDWDKIMAFCPGLIERAFEAAVDILQKHGKDIYE